MVSCAFTLSAVEQNPALMLLGIDHEGTCSDLLRMRPCVVRSSNHLAYRIHVAVPIQPHTTTSACGRGVCASAARRHGPRGLQPHVSLPDPSQLHRGVPAV